MSALSLSEVFFSENFSEFDDHINTCMQDYEESYQAVFRRELIGEDLVRIAEFVLLETLVKAADRGNICVGDMSSEKGAPDMPTCVILAEKLSLNTDVEYNPKWAVDLQDIAKEQGVSFTLMHRS